MTHRPSHARRFRHPAHRAIPRQLPRGGRNWGAHEGRDGAGRQFCLPADLHPISMPLSPRGRRRRREAAAVSRAGRSGPFIMFNQAQVPAHPSCKLLTGTARVWLNRRTSSRTVGQEPRGRQHLCCSYRCAGRDVRYTRRRRARRRGQTQHLEARQRHSEEVNNDLPRRAPVCTCPSDHTRRARRGSELAQGYRKMQVGSERQEPPSTSRSTDG